MAKAAFTPNANEQVFAEKVTADCWEQPGRFKKQVSGKAYFTDQRLVFLAGGLIGTESVSFEIPMNEIASVEPCLSPPAFPFGIKIKLKNGDKYMHHQEENVKQENLH